MRNEAVRKTGEVRRGKGGGGRRKREREIWGEQTERGRGGTRDR